MAASHPPKPPHFAHRSAAGVRSSFLIIPRPSVAPACRRPSVCRRPCTPRGRARGRRYRNLYVQTGGGVTRDAVTGSAGMPAKAVLQAATKHAAEKMGMGDRTGTLVPGKAADALLLDANPLDDLNVLVRQGHLTAVIRDGHLLRTSP